MAERSFIIDAWDFNESPAQSIVAEGMPKSNTWFHFQRDDSNLESWLLKSGVPEPIVSAVLEEDTRPRFQRLSDGFLLILRGVNLNEGAVPEDMLSLRILYYKGALYSFRKRSFKALQQIREKLSNSDGPDSVNDLIVMIIEQLNLRIEDVLDVVEDELEALETAELDNTSKSLQALALLHRRMLRLNRFIRPQGTALDKLSVDSEKWLDAELHQWLLNERDKVQRLLEQIDMMLDQAWMLREHMQQAVAEKMNRNTYWLSVIAGVFLPLSFLTGVFGINIAGMPGTEEPKAFEWFCWSLGGIAVIEFLLLRRLKFW